MEKQIGQATPPRDPILDVLQPALKIGVVTGTYIF